MRQKFLLLCLDYNHPTWLHSPLKVIFYSFGKGEGVIFKLSYNYMKQISLQIMMEKIINDSITSFRFNHLKLLCRNNALLTLNFMLLENAPCVECMDKGLCFLLFSFPFIKSTDHI